MNNNKKRKESSQELLKVAKEKQIELTALEIRINELEYQENQLTKETKCIVPRWLMLALESYRKWYKRTCFHPLKEIKQCRAYDCSYRQADDFEIGSFVENFYHLIDQYCDIGEDLLSPLCDACYEQHEEFQNTKQNLSFVHLKKQYCKENGDNENVEIVLECYDETARELLDEWIAKK